MRSNFGGEKEEDAQCGAGGHPFAVMRAESLGDGAVKGYAASIVALQKTCLVITPYVVV